VKNISSDEKSALGVLHLKRFWAKGLAKRNGQNVDENENDWRFDNIVLAGLNLALEETLVYLFQNAPTLAEFENWILAKNDGALDELQIERINCTLTGEKYSENLQKSLREIEEMPDVLSAEDLEFWDENGYVIVREIISREQASLSEKAVWEFLEMSPENVESWYEKPIGKGIMMNFYHHETLNLNRRSKRLKKAFAQLWNTADLWTTTDRTSFNPPETASYQHQGFKLHFDMSLEPPFNFGTQGLLYLCDVSADQGAFRLVPKFHKRLANWLKNLPENCDPREVNLDAEAVNIAANAGDFIIWHQHLPHGSSPNRADYPRIVQYLNMYPLSFKENVDWK